MKCKRVREQLALFVGGDLPEDQIEKLKTHVDQCVGCAAELAALKRAQIAVGEIARSDVPDPLPADFSSQVHRRIVAENEKEDIPDHGVLGRPRWRWAFVFAPIAAVILMVLILTQDTWHVGNGGKSISRQQATIPQTAENRTRPVTWDEIKRRFGQTIEGPYMLSSWNPPGPAGVYAVMHKPDPINEPETYRFDYCGENARLVSFRGNPWVDQWERFLVSRAGSRDNIYIAVFLMPESSRRDRREIEKALIKEYAPYFNRKNGV